MALVSELALQAPSSSEPVKTLFTPVFYAGPKTSKSTMPFTSSASSSTSTRATPYLNRLSSTHLALAQMVTEPPPSRPSSPSSESRIEELRIKACDAYEIALGEPGNGKWSYLVGVLKLGCTQGRYRWATCSSGDNQRNTEAGKVGCDDLRLPETEGEWNEWEREFILRQKVGAWQAKIPESHDPELLARVSTSLESQPEVIKEVDRTSDSQGAKAVRVKNDILSKPRTRDMKESSQLGFPVVKRSSVNQGAVGIKKGKSSEVGGRRKGNKESSRPLEVVDSLESVYQAGSLERRKRTSTSQEFETYLELSPPVILTSSIVDIGAETEGLLGVIPEAASKPSPEPINIAKAISDIPETSFLPPSFPSQLETSTPPVFRQKPAPIPFAASQTYVTSPPLSLQSSSKPVSRAKSGSMFPHDCDDSSQKSALSLNRKRPRPLTPPSDHIPGLPRTPSPALKRTRTVTSQPPIAGPSASARSGPQAATPPRSDALSRTPTSGRVRESSPRLRLPTLTDLIASAKTKARARPVEPPFIRKAKSPVPPRARLAMPEKVAREPSPVFIPDPSPAKSHRSLSSIAGSPDSPMDAPSALLHSPGSPTLGRQLHAFTPPFMSTQHHYPGSNQMLSLPFDGLGTAKAAGGAFFGMGYSSQYDVEGRVDRVSEILERDVDFDGWLKDVSDEGRKQSREPESP